MDCKEFRDKHPDKEDCLSNGTTAEEKGKKFRIVMPKGHREQFLKIAIDKGLLKEIDLQTKKCDFGFIRCYSEEFYFVELKGNSGLKGAFQQIKTTVEHFRKTYSIPKEKISAFIVSAGVPKSANQQFAKMKQEFKKNYGVALDKQTRQYDLHIQPCTEKVKVASSPSRPKAKRKKQKNK